MTNEDIGAVYFLAALGCGLMGLGIFLLLGVLGIGLLTKLAIAFCLPVGLLLILSAAKYA